MAQTGHYFLARISKFGLLDDDLLVKSILQPTPFYVRDAAWTFMDAGIHSSDGNSFVFGKLTKFRPEGEVETIDPAGWKAVLREEPNLVIASSPFVFIPSHSGISHMEVPGHIESHRFHRRFSEIVRQSNDAFFVDAVLEPISDIRSFAEKLKALDKITALDAKVFPPNPLFGPLWERLEKYLRARKAEELRINERASSSGLTTNLRDAVFALSEGNIEAAIAAKPSISDSAVLMAADGYGTGRVSGIRNDERVVIRVSETVRNFTFDRDPEPLGLYRITLDILDQVNRDRSLRHESPEGGSFAS